MLGVNCSSREAHLTAVDGGEAVVPELTERLEVPIGMEAGEALLELLDAARRVLREIRPEKLVLLMPETWNAAYTQHVERAALETVIRLGAAMEDVGVEQLARPTVRSRLGLPRSGPLDSHVTTVVAPVGRYWNAGRDLAALAALAGSRP